MSRGRIEFLNLKSINLRRSREFESAFRRVLRSGRYILGEEVSSFEPEFAKYCGVKFSAGVASGVVTTDDSRLADCIWALRNCGSHLKYLNKYKGFISCLDELQAGYLC